MVCWILSIAASYFSLHTWSGQSFGYVCDHIQCPNSTDCYPASIQGKSIQFSWFGDLVVFGNCRYMVQLFKRERCSLEWIDLRGRKLSIFIHFVWYLFSRCIFYYQGNDHKMLSELFWFHQSTRKLTLFPIDCSIRKDTSFESPVCQPQHTGYFDFTQFDVYSYLYIYNRDPYRRTAVICNYVHTNCFWLLYWGLR